MFERGDLPLVPFPFSDLSAIKRRPILVAAPPDLYGDFIALPVTSRPQHQNVLALSQSDLVEGTLPAPSYIRTDRIVTLHTSVVIKSFGRVSERIVSEAVARFCARLGVPRPR